MKARPTIFLSGVSHEFGSFRDAVENEIQMKGCFAENQPSFSPDYRTVEEMLRRRLHDSDAVIHIAGFRFGAEPKHRPVDAPRRSYTQMEFHIAREMEKPVYVFLSTDANVRDAAKSDEKPEDAETAALQSAHRTAVQDSNYLYYFFKDKAELCKLAAEIPPVQAAGFRADISRIVKYAPTELIGRESETKLLDDAWLKVRRAESPRPHVLTIVALGGEGKTSLVAKWAAELAARDWPGCDAAFAWSFYSQGTREQMAASSDLFLKEALTFFGDDADKQFAASSAGAYEKGQRLARIVGQRRSLLILDGLEPLQYAPTSPTPGQLKDQGIAALLNGLATASHGLCVVTTRYSIPDLRAFWQTTAPEVKLLRLSRDYKAEPAVERQKRGRWCFLVLFIGWILWIASNEWLPVDAVDEGDLGRLLHQTCWIGYDPSDFALKPNGPPQYPSLASIDQDLASIRDAGFTGIVTFSSSETLAAIPEKAKSLGLFVIMGIWNAKNRSELEQALDQKDYVDAYCVGHNGYPLFYSLDELKAAIRLLKKQSGRPVTTTQPSLQYEHLPDLAHIGDWLFPDAHISLRPGDNKPSDANPDRDIATFRQTAQRLAEIAQRSDQQLVFNSVSYPHGGISGASADKQAEFFQGVLRIVDGAERALPVRFSIIPLGAFDAPWKTRGSYEAWDPFTGLLSSNGRTMPASRMILDHYRRPLHVDNESQEQKKP